MPERPFPITETEPSKILEQMQLQLAELYEERIGGANIGDVFAIGDDDILALQLATNPGLEKTSNQLRAKVKSGGGVTRDTDGLSLTYPQAKVPLIISTGGGTCNVEAITGTQSINFDVDGEIAYASFKVPDNWDAASDLTIKALVQNEIAEDDGDDVSFTATVHGIADGETNADAGQTVAMTLDLTGGDEAINKVNLVSGTIDYDHATYPITAGDTVIIKLVVNLAGVGECDGPLHIIDWWVEYN